MDQCTETQRFYVFTASMLMPLANNRWKYPEKEQFSFWLGWVHYLDLNTFTLGAKE